MIVQLESIPELQELKRNYESMTQRLTQLEEESRAKVVLTTESSPAVTNSPSTSTESPPAVETVEKSEYESTITRLMQQIFTLESQVQKMVILW